LHDHARPARAGGVVTGADRELVRSAGPLRLERWPRRPDDPLRAWDAADELLLARLDAEPPAPETRVLLINDACGALACALHAHRPTSWGDSELARLAARANLAANGLDPSAVTFLPGDAAPAAPVDLALIKIPKSLDLFADQLRMLRPALAPGALVLAGSMVKHTSGRAYALLEERIGRTVTGRAAKKARLAEAAPGPVADAAPSQPGYRLAEFALDLSSVPGVFAADRLDIGTRALLEHLPRRDDALRACDLGCGNGALGLALARVCPQAAVLFTDESDRAVAAARANAAANGLGQRTLEFRVADGLEPQPPASLDLILCNPPFHLGHAVEDLTAPRLFAQAERCLRPGGAILAVGNRHLGHHAKLARIFGACDVAGETRKFQVLRATKRG